jgi:Asp-tRNA(Asn)/Glu-tRNA(Gln) amidotransferase A subunit family amidase
VLPAELAEAADEAHHVIMSYEMRDSLAWEVRERFADLPPLIAARVSEAAAITPAAYDAARGTARRARLAARQLFGADGIDAVLTHAAPGPAPARATTGDPRFNRLFTLLGLPCVAVPGLRCPDGLPIGLQVVGPFARDAATLAAAGVLERALRQPLL